MCRSLLALLFVGAALSLAILPTVAPVDAQESGVDPDDEFEVEPCCQDRVAPEEAQALRESGVREIPRPGAGFDPGTMARMADEGLRMAPRGRELDVLGPQDAFRALAPGVKKKFNGMDMDEAGSFIPPDTALAVGPEHILQAVNVAFRLTDKNGKNEVFQTGEEHFGTSGLFDPKVHYDPESGRYFIVILSLDRAQARSKVWISVSRSSTPQSLGSADWCSYSFNAKKQNAWADYPGLGVSGDWVAVGTNNFGLSDNFFKSAWLWAMRKSTLVENATKCPKNKVFAFKVAKNKAGTIAFTLQPAQHLDDSARANGDMYIMASEPVGFSTDYGLWTLAGKGNKKPKLSSKMVTGSGYSFPPDAEQKKGDKVLDTIGHRLMQQVVVRDGAIWLAHASGCTTGNSTDVFSCIRVERFPLGADTSDFSDLFGANQRYLWVPGIAVANNGDVVATFQMSGAKQFLSTGLAGLRGGAARFGPIRPLFADFDTVKSVFKGKCATELGSDPEQARSGDYIGAAQDPETDDVWISGEWTAKLSGRCGWKTTVGRVRY